VTAFAAENIEIAGMRIALQPLLDLQRQAVHAAPMSVWPTASHTRTPEGTAIIAPITL
jgi:hypothetical protein